MRHPFAGRWNHNTHHYPRLLAQVPASARHLVDVGCGEGTFCRYASERVEQVTGIDPDASVLPDPSGGVDYLQGSAERLPLDDASVDAVTMTAVLHHCDVRVALAEARRVLAPGGVLLVLGIGGFGGWRDVPFEARDVLTHQVLSRLHTSWEPPTVRTAPGLTWDQTRALVDAHLPGATHRRLPLWRSLTTWRQPA